MSTVPPPKPIDTPEWADFASGISPALSQPLSQLWAEYVKIKPKLTASVEKPVLQEKPHGWKKYTPPTSAITGAPLAPHQWNPPYFSIDGSEEYTKVDDDEEEVEMETTVKKPRRRGTHKYNKTVLDYARNIHNKVEYIPPEKEIGLEIECEGTHLFKTPTVWWCSHVDFSLRNYKGHAPQEYVLASPIKRSDLDKALDYIITRLSRKKTELYLSERCSVHVHLNCQSMTIKQALTFLCIYLVFEEILVEWCGETRVGNIFCLRASDAHYFVKFLSDCITNDSYNNIYHNDNIRYTSVNVCSLPNFGSLEFRALRGTVDKAVITEWVDILLGLKASSLMLRNPRDIIESFEVLGPKEFISTYLGEKFQSPLNRERVWDGIRMIRELAYCSDWAEDKHKKMEKE